MAWLDRFKPHQGAVHLPGQALPEPEYETATGRRLYTVQQMRAAYAQGAKDSRSLLVRCRNLLSHPSHWFSEAEHIATRERLYAEIIAHVGDPEYSRDRA